MTRRLQYPETSIAKEVHCFFKGSKLNPGTRERLPTLGRTTRVEEAPIPLRVLVQKMTRAAEFLGPGSEISFGVGEAVTDGSTMVKVGVAITQLVPSMSKISLDFYFSKLWSPT